MLFWYNHNMSEVAKTNNPAAAETTDWGELADFGQENPFNSPTAETTETLESPDQPEAPPTPQTEETIARAKAAVLESINQNPEQEPVEMVTFGALKIPRESLHEDKILIDEVKHRSKLDLIGRKKDQKTLDHLYEMEEWDEEEVKKLMTPTVAGLFLEEMKEDGIPNGDRSLELLDTLPIAAQADCLSSTADPALLLHQTDTLAWWSARNPKASGWAHKKLAAAVASLDNSSAKGETVDLSTIPNLDEHFWDMASELPKSERSKIYEAITSHGADKRAASLRLFDYNEIIENYQELIGDPKSLTLEEMLTLEQRFNISKMNPEERNEELFPSELVGVLSKYSLGMARSRYSRATLEDIHTMESLAADNPEIWNTLGFDAQQLIESQLCGDLTSDFLTEIVQKWSLEPSLLGQAKKYLHDRRGFDMDYGKITSVEQLSHLDALILQKAEESLENKDYDSARDEICRYQFGMSLEALASDLVATGIIRMSKGDKAKLAKDGFFTSDFLNKHDTKLKLDFNVERLRELGKTSKEDEATALVALHLIGAKDRNLEKILASYKENHENGNSNLLDCLRRCRSEYSRRTSRNYHEYMQKSIAGGTQPVGSFDIALSNGEQRTVPVLEMQSDEWMLLVHHLGAYWKKDLDDPSQWDSPAVSLDRDSNGRPTGYISTTAIGNQSLYVAPEGSIDEPDGIFYVFSNLEDEAIKAMGEHDLYVGQQGFDREGDMRTAAQDFFYDDPRELLEATNERINSKNNGLSPHNEVVLDRYQKTAGSERSRRRPDYLIHFGTDQTAISERVKQHAAYFGVPIIMIDPNRYQ